MTYHGVIKNVNYERGFGFATAENVDYFFHKSALTDEALFGGLQTGDAVELLEVEQAPKGWRCNSLAVPNPQAAA